MFDGYHSSEELAQSLTDVECSDTMITNLLSCLRDGNKTEGIRLLEARREELLNEIHKKRADIEFLNELLCSLRGQ